MATKTINDLTIAELRDVMHVYAGDVDVTIAQALDKLEADRKRAAENGAANRELKRQVDAWIADRAEAGRQAAREAREQNVHRGALYANEKANEAGYAAKKKFEREVERPRTPNGDWAIPDAALFGDHRGLVKRVAGEVREAVAS